MSKPRFALSILRHKRLVFSAGWRLGVPLWRLIIHDLSKLLPSEFRGYFAAFGGGSPLPQDVRGLLWGRAWIHHQNRNDHHWEYWIPRTGTRDGTAEEGKPHAMPLEAVSEMVADWLAASQSYSGVSPARSGEWPWLEASWGKIRLHPRTRALVLGILRRVPSRFGMSVECRVFWDDMLNRLAAKDVGDPIAPRTTP